MRWTCSVVWLLKKAWATMIAVEQNDYFFYANIVYFLCISSWVQDIAGAAILFLAYGTTHVRVTQDLLDELEWHERFVNEQSPPPADADATERRRRIAAVRARLAPAHRPAAQPQPLPPGLGTRVALQWLGSFALLCLHVRFRHWGLRTSLWTQLLCVADKSWRAVRQAYLTPI